MVDGAEVAGGQATQVKLVPTPQADVQGEARKEGKGEGKGKGWRSMRRFETGAGAWDYGIIGEGGEAGGLSGP